MRKHIVFTIFTVAVGTAMSSTTFARGLQAHGSAKAHSVGAQAAPARRMAPSRNIASVPRAVPRVGSSRVLPGRPNLYRRPIVPYYPYSAALGLGWYDNPFWYGGPWPYGGYGYSYAQPIGGLRLKVEPSTAQVYVDGYYAGVVDDYNGHFQHLNLTPGGHQIELRAPHYQTLPFDIYVQPDHTTEWQGKMLPSQANG